MRDPARLEALLDRTSDFVLWVDRRGVVVEANAAASGLADVVDLLPEIAYTAAEARGTWTGDVQVLARNGRMLDASAVVVEVDGLFAVVLRDISDRKAQESLLRRMAERDSLTGLRNRHVLLSHLEQAVAGASRGRTGALLYIDLDHLKQVNDTGGHAAGDAYLTEFAAALENAVRAEDLVARVGGDEFAVLMRSVPPQGALEVAAGVSDRLSGMAVSASIGVAVIDGSSQPDDVVMQADEACYAAKAKGGNRVELYDAP
ncbi:MAG TPA: GGDEF domain-containing protein [Acidimicrobiales bacterium]|nr:GGDEF domain-containing protein [Acidimicrobiales bacterium]